MQPTASQSAANPIKNDGQTLPNTIVKMTITPLSIPEVLLIQPKVFEDKRGYFYESFNAEKFNDLTGLNPNFVQDNQSKSSYGVIRGLHYQIHPKAQAKLVRVVEGEIYDVAVDIRENSPTFGQFVGVTLSAENKSQLYIPVGFAHGFSVLSESATVIYKVDDYYSKENERGINLFDTNLNIDWQIPEHKRIISEKDMILPILSNI